MNLEFIDSAGSNDSSDNGDKNLVNWVNYLKTKNKLIIFYFIKICRKINRWDKIISIGFR